MAWFRSCSRSAACDRSERPSRRGTTTWALAGPRILPTVVCMIATIATALYSVPCSQYYTCGLSQQSDTLHELSTLYRSASYLVIRHTRDIKRVQLNRHPQQSCRL